MQRYKHDEFGHYRHAHGEWVKYSDTRWRLNVDEPNDYYVWECLAEGCTVVWEFEVGGPDENGVKYCPGCGRKIAALTTKYL